ncbi:MAG: hypothetical protein WBA74_08535 [Cyclobacteriaceae bacterium]
MLKNIIKVQGVKTIDKSIQKALNGGDLLLPSTKCQFGEVFDLCQMRCIVPTCNPQNFIGGCLANGFTCSNNDPWDS